MNVTLFPAKLFMQHWVLTTEPKRDLSRLCWRPLCWISANKFTVTAFFWICFLLLVATLAFGCWAGASGYVHCCKNGPLWRLDMTALLFFFLFCCFDLLPANTSLFSSLDTSMAEKIGNRLVRSDWSWIRSAVVCRECSAEWYFPGCCHVPPNILSNYNRRSTLLLLLSPLPFAAIFLFSDCCLRVFLGRRSTVVFARWVLQLVVKFQFFFCLLPGTHGAQHIQRSPPVTQAGLVTLLTGTHADKGLGLWTCQI